MNNTDLHETSTAVLDVDPFPEITHPQKRAFLSAFIERAGNVTKACQDAGISRRTPHSQPWADDTAFQSCWARARRMAAESLESVAIGRAVEGEKPSDTLAIFLLKGMMPEKYGDRLQVGGGIAHVHLTAEQMKQLPDPAISRIAAGENVAAVLASIQPKMLGQGQDALAEAVEEDAEDVTDAEDGV